MPLLFNLIIPLTEEPLYVVNVPPTIILPSDWVANLFTWALNPTPVTNEVSWVPFVFNRIIRVVLVEEPLYVVKFPPTKIFPYI